MRENPVVDFSKVIDQTHAENLAGRNIHDHLKDLDMDELREMSQKDRLPFHVMCLSLTGDLNIGSIVRSAHLMGAEKVWIFGRRKYDKRGAVGAYNYVDVESVFGFEGDPTKPPITLEFNPDTFRAILSKNNLFPVFVEQGGVPLNIFNWKFLSAYYNRGLKACLIFGNETNGIPDGFIQEGNYVVSIPQRGVIRSHNVSNAAGIVMWDMVSRMEWI